MDRGSLVVRGGTDNSTSNIEQSTEDKFKMFAVMRLERYVFITAIYRTLYIKDFISWEVFLKMLKVKHVFLLLG